MHENVCNLQYSPTEKAPILVAIHDFLKMFMQTYK